MHKLYFGTYVSTSSGRVDVDRDSAEVYACIQASECLTCFQYGEEKVFSHCTVYLQRLGVDTAVLNLRPEFSSGNYASTLAAGGSSNLV